MPALSFVVPLAWKTSNFTPRIERWGHPRWQRAAWGTKQSKIHNFTLFYPNHVPLAEISARNWLTNEWMCEIALVSELAKISAKP